MRYFSLHKFSSVILILAISALLYSCGGDEKNTEYVDDKATEKQNVKKEVKEEKVTIDSTLVKSEEQSTDNKKEFKEYDPTAVVAVISPLEADNYHGKMVTVKGFVADIYKSEKVAYLNFVKKYPDNPFTAVIFARSFADFPDLDKYNNKEVEVTGIMSKFKGKPQIILNEPGKLKMK